MLRRVEDEGGKRSVVVYPYLEKLGTSSLGGCVQAEKRCKYFGTG